MQRMDEFEDEVKYIKKDIAELKNQIEDDHIIFESMAPKGRYCNIMYNGNER